MLLKQSSIRNQTAPKKRGCLVSVLLFCFSWVEKTRFQRISGKYNFMYYAQRSRIKTVRAGERDCPQANPLSKQARNFD